MDAQTEKYLKYGGIAALLLGGYYFFFMPKNESGTTNDPTNNAPGTIDNFNAKNIAETLYEAMAASGTDEDKIFNTLKPLTSDQFNAVRLQFGKRSYNATLGNQVNLTLPTWSPLYTPLPLVDLKGWLNNELDAQRYTTLRLKFPQYL